MGNVFPPFKVDIAGALCLPAVLRDARLQCRNGQISLLQLRATEDAEVRRLVDFLKSQGLQVVTDGGYRDVSMIDDWDAYRQTVIDSFSFLTGVTGGDVLAKQQLPSPAEILSRLLSRRGVSIDEADDELKMSLAADVVTHITLLIEDLYASGCRYIQFNGVHSTADGLSVQLNNRVLASLPAGMFVAFHAPTEMLVRLEGVDAYFLNYDGEACDRNRLLWLIHRERSVFGFVLSHYPDEDEMDELSVKIGDVLHYVPLSRLTLCMPDASMLRSSTDADEQRQWETLRLGMQLAEQMF